LWLKVATTVGEQRVGRYNRPTLLVRAKKHYAQALEGYSPLR
jgi:hypothetical protein